MKSQIFLYELKDNRINFFLKVKTLYLLQWGGTRVIGRQTSGAYLLRKGIFFFEATLKQSPGCCRTSTGSLPCRPRPYDPSSGTAVAVVKLIIAGVLIYLCRQKKYKFFHRFVCQRHILMDMSLIFHNFTV